MIYRLQRYEIIVGYGHKKSEAVGLAFSSYIDYRLHLRDFLNGNTLVGEDSQEVNT
jgi:hypothetical protein